MHLVSAIGVAGVLYYGVHLILSGVITSGSFVSFLAALIMLYTPIKTIGNNYISVQQALLALDRIYQLLEEESFEDGKDQDKEVLQGINKSIEFKDVHFSYNPDREILKGISFKVPTGKKIALVGNSGGGKTTVCSLIPRLYEVDSGEILIDGVEQVTSYSVPMTRGKFSSIFVQLMENDTKLTVADWMDYMRQYKEVGIDTFIIQYSVGYGGQNSISWYKNSSVNWNGIQTTYDLIDRKNRVMMNMDLHKAGHVMETQKTSSNSI